jgi:hypothetical protein
MGGAHQGKRCAGPFVEQDDDGLDGRQPGLSIGGEDGHQFGFQHPVDIARNGHQDAGIGDLGADLGRHRRPAGAEFDEGAGQGIDQGVGVEQSTDVALTDGQQG